MKKEPIEPAPKTDPVPPPKGWAAVWKHLQNWQSIYILLPMSILSIWGISKVAKLITGREPQENTDWLVGNSGNVMKLVYLILFVEFLRQQTGIWLTRDQQIENPTLAWAQTFGTSVALCVGAYILQH